MQWSIGSGSHANACKYSVLPMTQFQISAHCNNAHCLLCITNSFKKWAWWIGTYDFNFPQQIQISSNKIRFVVGCKAWDSCIYKQIYTRNQKNALIE